MTITTCLSIITLNINRINALIKRHRRNIILGEDQPRWQSRKTMNSSHEHRKITNTQYKITMKKTGSSRKDLLEQRHKEGTTRRQEGGADL